MPETVTHALPTSYRIAIERDGDWWDITAFVTRYTAPIRGTQTLYVREPLPVSLPTRLQITWRETVPAAAWDDPLWGRLAPLCGIQPDVEYEGSVTWDVGAIIVDPAPQSRSAGLARV